MKICAKNLLAAVTLIITILAFVSDGQAKGLFDNPNTGKIIDILRQGQDSNIQRLAGVARSQNDPVARYTFNSGFQDSSGNGNSGTVVGDVRLADDSVVGKCAVFNNGYIEVPSSPALNMGSGYTISAWVLVDPAAAANNKSLSIVSKLDDRAVYNVYHAYARGGFGARLEVRFAPNGEDSVNNGPYDNYQMSANWTHLLFTFDGNNFFLYVNGTLKGTKAVSPAKAVAASNGKLRIGTGNDINSSSLFFAGKMADVRLYNRALSTQEIQNVYTAGANVR